MRNERSVRCVFTERRDFLRRSLLLSLSPLALSALGMPAATWAMASRNASNCSLWDAKLRMASRS